MALLSFTSRITSCKHKMVEVASKNKVRSIQMPTRNAIGELERLSIQECLDYYDSIGMDPGYQGKFEQKYCDLFCEIHGGGYADVVATGTAALYVAIAALNLPKGSNVLVSPITDPGTLNAIVLNGLKPKLIDTQQLSYNTGAQQILDRIDSNTSCAVLVHAAGEPLDMPEIIKVCKNHNILVLEDCSQAHGAKLDNQYVGTFGDIAAFSTMYRKASITGPCGGVVYTRNRDLHHLALAHADRGKPTWRDDFDDRDPTNYLFPALNLHSNEIACAIGYSSLNRLESSISNRRNFVHGVKNSINSESKVCSVNINGEVSPFYLPVFVNPDKITCSKTEFAIAIREEGIPLNPYYKYLVSNWKWLQGYLNDSFSTPNARDTIEHSFCIYLNENYTEVEVKDTIKAIAKIERKYLKQ